MAGIEQLEIHSKSYIVRWAKVDEGHTISWSVQPHKKSINFGIVKHPGSGATSLTSQPTVDELNETFENLQPGGGRNGRFSKNNASTAQEQLQSKGFLLMKWHGKCEADKVSMGALDVVSGQGGMFGLVFDNTFSKQTSKHATFVLLTFPTGQPPQTTHHLPNLQPSMAAAMNKINLGKPSPRLGAAGSDSVESLQSSHATNKAGSVTGPGEGATPSAAYHTGTLLKRRRKKGQGYARRYFSLDFSSCTLAYYYNRNSSALRGAIPLSLAAIAADERRREITIDSGAEVWHLRASNAKDFNDWARALERASRIARGLEPGPEPLADGVAEVQDKPTLTPRVQAQSSLHEGDREWEQVESLVSRVVGTRDALRRLVKDMAAQKGGRPTSSYQGSSNSALEDGDASLTPSTQERRSFWRRKSTAMPSGTPTTLQPGSSSGLGIPPPGTFTNVSANGSIHGRPDSQGSRQEESTTHDHCAALLNDLDKVVAEFTNVISSSKRRRMASNSPAAAERKSLDSTASDEFFDAEGGDTDSRGKVMMIGQGQSEEDEEEESEAEDEASIHSSSSVSSVEEEESPLDAKGTAALYPMKVKSLHPLPIDIAVDRRTTIPPATVMPPSLIAFVRKNVGKDLTAISMPVSANEPISMLQRVAEQLEYAPLLDIASTLKSAPQRLLYVTAFAISGFSVSRAKERAIRKPFNPLLGETFELLRTESEVPGGFRLIAEKVCHRPVRIAMQADSASWSFAQSPAPSQKFWGKSAELITEGKVRIVLKLPDGTEELYSWTIATMFLRNVVMGEKYVEPVGSMTVSNDTTGAKANIEFRAKGMFGGRGEDVQVETYGPDGGHTSASMNGTWTTSLRMTEKGGAGKEVWKAGDLVPNAANTYGMTTFAASLNEITEVEKGRLPITDSRLRPDQRLAEQGRLDDAEREKVRLEEAQRTRRREMEDKGESWTPRWFVRVAGGDEQGEEVWKLKTGKEGYWEAREKKWTGYPLVKIF